MKAVAFPPGAGRVDGAPKRRDLPGAGEGPLGSPGRQAPSLPLGVRAGAGKDEAVHCSLPNFLRILLRLERGQVLTMVRESGEARVSDLPQGLLSALGDLEQRAGNWPWRAQE